MQIYNCPIVFFDLDDTLINKDANTLWIKWRAKTERWAIVEGLLAILSLYRAYKNGKITHSRLSNYYRTRGYGLTFDEYVERVEQFFQEQGHLHIYPQAASLLFAYQQRNTRVVMITGADDVVAKAYAKALGIEDVICNRLLVRSNRIEGLEQPLCYGEGKVVLAQAYLSKLGLGFEHCAFYTDSHADLPLLEKVAQPVVLNPNPQLKFIAKSNHWPCLDWRD
ncbi:MAG: HAD-IB family hydrolase [Venatoribacter sp.]